MRPPFIKHSIDALILVPHPLSQASSGPKPGRAYELGSAMSDTDREADENSLCTGEMLSSLIHRQVLPRHKSRYPRYQIPD